MQFPLTIQKDQQTLSTDAKKKEPNNILSNIYKGFPNSFAES